MPKKLMLGAASALALLAATMPARAQNVAEPANDPGTWAVPEDYPKGALFANLAGSVEFD